MNLMKRYFLSFLFFSIFLYTVSLSAQEVNILKTGVVKVKATTYEGKHRVGTGFIVQLEKDVVYIVTASHVVEGALNNEAEIEFFTRRNRVVPSKTIHMEGQNPRGLAILIVKENIPSGLSVLKLSSSNSVKDGDHVITIGFPRLSNVQWAVIGGNILGRSGSAITFSGAVDKGNSGGPLIKQGQVIGVVTQAKGKYAYAIPAEIAQITL
jgi:S1-C subfamily serine protease